MSENQKINLESKPALVEYLRNGAKPRENRRVGVEVEVFGFDAETCQRLSNEQIKQVFSRLADSPDRLTLENGLIVECSTENGGKFTIEPGGQIEFSSVPRKNLAEIEADLQKNFTKLQTVGHESGFKFAALGFDPLCRLEEQNWSLKPRYQLMQPYLATRGRRAWDMMTRTCAVQINLDYADENDLVKKFQVANRLAPVSAAIFANSPFADGHLNGFKSNRVLTWLETDADRCGISPPALRDNFTFEDFVEYTLDVPMLFVRRGENWLDDFTGRRFRDFLQNDEITPFFTDWTEHLTTIFTEARLKNYLEIRSADGGNLAQALAVCTFWKGLLYDADALDEALKIAPKLSAAEFYTWQKCVAKNALAAACGEINTLQLARNLIKLAWTGLEKIAPEELKYLKTTRQRILFGEKSPADFWLVKPPSQPAELIEKARFIV
jgi:glutamate--cysteine ligase